MKSKIAYFFMLILCCASVHAQQVHLGPLHSSDNPREDWLLPATPSSMPNSLSYTRVSR